MSDPAIILILFGTGCLAGIINVLAGGGSTLSLPVLILLGVDANVANGTNRVAIVLQNVVATGSFVRNKQSQLAKSFMFGLWALPGAVIGAFAATRIADIWFERIVGVLLIAIVISMILPTETRANLSGPQTSKWIAPVLFGIGVYGGFIQMGVGFLFMAAFFHLLRLDLVTVTVHKVTIILLYSVPTLCIFALSGNVDWVLGLALGAGNASGAYVAVRLAVRRGENVIRYMLILAAMVMALRILGIL